MKVDGANWVAQIQFITEWLQMSKVFIQVNMAAIGLSYEKMFKLF